MKERGKVMLGGREVGVGGGGSYSNGITKQKNRVPSHVNPITRGASGPNLKMEVTYPAKNC